MADNTNAYATVNPLQGNVSDWIGNQEQMDFAYRQEQRQVDAIEQAKKDKAQAKLDAQRERYESLKGATPSGIKAVDSFSQSIINQAMDKRLELWKKQESGKPLTLEESALYRKLDKTPETLDLIIKSYMDTDKRYYDAVAKGTAQRDLDYEAKREKMIDGAIPFIDDNGEIAIGMDNDGDGKPDIISFDPNSGLSLKPNFIPNISVDDAVKAYTGTLEAQKNTTDRNFISTTTTGIPLTVAHRGAKELIYDRAGNYSPLAVSEFYKAGIRNADDITPEMAKRFETYLTDRILNSKQRGTEVNVDYGAMNASQREQRLGRGEKKENVATLNDLSQTGVRSERTGGPSIGNIYQGNVNIKRKVANGEETFRGFDILDDGNVGVIVDVAVPELGADDKKTGKTNIKTKKYYSKGNADKIKANADIVSYYAQRFQDPETGEFIKDLNELREKLNGQSPAASPANAPQNNSSGKQKISGF